MKNFSICTILTHLADNHKIQSFWNYLSIGKDRFIQIPAGVNVLMRGFGNWRGGGGGGPAVQLLETMYCMCLASVTEPSPKYRRNTFLGKFFRMSSLWYIFLFGDNMRQTTTVCIALFHLNPLWPTHLAPLDDRRGVAVHGAGYLNLLAARGDHPHHGGGGHRRLFHLHLALQDLTLEQQQQQQVAGAHTAAGHPIYWRVITDRSQV